MLWTYSPKWGKMNTRKLGEIDEMVLLIFYIAAPGAQE